ncbi:uncharacterized protein UV8b_06546 [Ustilaginoidea virens]|uniref:DNA-directed RNA polymerase I subunit rpa49 n=1 Tax=Ustilaginoidea virens TaxID=1159556 RepID=A0A8E5HVS7_USTVR|nr:uncharacterized protein UV8b_06546 [Ustilaginoidea virens]QUC22305.1 hypothetical protein UV8b_06546 [Ustilaginoidea virens]
MADASNKKRKRDDGAPPSQPKKKVALHVPGSRVAVSSLLQPKTCPPIIATAPGLQVPRDAAFHLYQSRQGSRAESNESNGSKNAGTQQILLHSTSHPSLDYTAKEEGNRGAALGVRHFVAIYDAKSGKLQVVEAKKMVVRGAVRAKQAPASAMGEVQSQPSMTDRRADLGQTFGTKKAKKALRDTVINAIAPQSKGGDAEARIDDAGRAVFQAVGQATSRMATREALQAAVDAAKPVPRANVDAQAVEDVYDPEAIIGADVLNLVPVREWQEKAEHKESIRTISRFVAARVNALATATSKDAVTRLRVLRYYNLVLTFYLGTKPGKQRGTRLVAPREKLRELLAPAPEAVVENIRRRFSDAGVVRKYHLDLLMAYCCVLACIVDGFEVDTQNLREDLRLDQKTINGYFHEIGGRVKPVGSKAEGGRLTHVGKLALPLRFPKQRQMARRRK